MIRRILITALVLIVIGLIIIWLIEGGAQATSRTAHRLTNPIDLILNSGTSSGFLLLPWQPQSVRGPDISGYADEANTLGNAASGDQKTYDQGRPAQTRSFGNPSPFASEIVIADSAVGEGGPSSEYLELDASGNNQGAINITGWSLQSAVTGIRVMLPPAAPVFVLGTVNAVAPVYLDPGASALVTTGSSPLGVSFRENSCTGFLAQLQHFTPDISYECPAASDMLPETPENLRAYGASCFDYLHTLPRCYFPGGNLPSNLSSACHTFIANTVSYNGCVNQYRYTSSFSRAAWRIYLGQSGTLWSSSHDVIRLLDADGQTVDALTY